MKIFIGIASAGRSVVIDAALRRVAAQTRAPDRVIICTPDQEAYTVDLSMFGLPIEHITHRRGLCSQRNAILELVGIEDGILLFIDDDFLLHEDYLRNIDLLADAYPDVALFNGTILKDGIIGPGLTVQEANALLAAYRDVPQSNPRVENKVAAYGCNMAIRLVHSRTVKFDERLPLYGWQEDVDYSCRLRAHGRIVQTDVISGVHLGVKLGRTSGVRLGYSQIINPIYLARKRTMGLGHVLRLVARNILMNVVKATRPEPYIDRKGRLKGNILAARDLVTGRIDPTRVLSLD